MAAEFMGNPNLDPERSVQGDLWIDGSFERVALHVGLFGRKIYDYITIQPTALPKRLPLSPPTVFQYVNGKATFRGFDASASAALSSVLTLDASLAYLHGNDDALNEPAIGVAPVRSSLGLRFEDEGGRFYLGGVLNLVGEQDEVAFAWFSSRAGPNVKALLGDFSGTLLSDGYSAYASYVAQATDIVHAQCWAHYPESAVIRSVFRNELGALGLHGQIAPDNHGATIRGT